MVGGVIAAVFVGLFFSGVLDTEKKKSEKLFNFKIKKKNNFLIY